MVAGLASQPDALTLNRHSPFIESKYPHSRSEAHVVLNFNEHPSSNKFRATVEGTAYGLTCGHASVLLTSTGDGVCASRLPQQDALRNGFGVKRRCRHAYASPGRGEGTGIRGDPAGAGWVACPRDYRARLYGNYRVL